MIKIINIGQQARTAVAEGSVRGIIGPAETGTRARVAIQDVDAGKAHRVAPSDRTQVAYVLDGQGARAACTSAGETREQELPRRAGVYLEPGEEATITAGGGALTLLLVSVPKHTAKANDVASPRGYVFVESALRSLIDERAIRERTFWVNKETGLSQSWDLQIGRMAYAPRAHSPRHVHQASKTSPVTPEHFYFIEKGTGEVKEDSGSRPVGPGDLVLIPAGEWHQLLASDSGFDYIEFQAPFDFMTTMDHDPLGKNWYIKGTDDGTGKPQRWVQS
ncbi:MAG TPA: cupin domain-containing protein [Vicinamibacterales bacterium]|nr:cupin domain-containing protein [Vicinamibacterales bacterium]